MSDLHCPACGADLDLAALFSAQADAKALERLVALSYPVGTQVLRYIGLHKPPKHSLTSRKKIKLLLELLPDLERGHITRAGRDWAAPKSNWAACIDQMLATAQAGRLDLPLKGHGYLYAMLQGMADKAEAAQERQTEADKRTAAPTPTVTVRGAAMPSASVGQAIANAFGGRDPALAALDERDRAASPMPAAVRELRERLKGGTHVKPD